MPSTICTINNCEKKIRQLNLCSTHASQHYRNKNRERALEYLGGKCVNCGTTTRLEFDHIDPSTVSFRISQKLKAAWPVLKAELDKCQLLCHPCHWIKTCKDLNKVSFQITPHGTTNAYCNHECRCDLCKEAWAIYKKERRGRLASSYV